MRGRAQKFAVFACSWLVRNDRNLYDEWGCTSRAVAGFRAGHPRLEWPLGVPLILRRVGADPTRPCRSAAECSREIVYPGWTPESLRWPFAPYGVANEGAHLMLGARSKCSRSLFEERDDAPGLKHTGDVWSAGMQVHAVPSEEPRAQGRQWFVNGPCDRRWYWMLLGNHPASPGDIA